MKRRDLTRMSREGESVYDQMLREKDNKISMEEFM